MQERPYMLRLRFVMILMVLMWLALWGRVGQIQVLSGGKYSAIVEDQRVRPITIDARRGGIFDRNGVELATDVSSASYEIRPSEIKDAGSAVTLLSRATDLSAGKVRSLVNSDREYVWLARQVSPAVMRRLDALKLSGLRKIPEYRRYYPFGSIGAQLLGYCDVDNSGIEGCELFAEDSLAGRDGRSVALLDALGRAATSLDAPVVEPENGADVHLTIDWKIQEIADEELTACVEKYDAVWGGAVVLDPGTGEILAMSNVPTFDPNSPGDADASNRRNRMVTDMVEPGSTFKIVAFAEAFESGVLAEDDLIDCENGKYRIGRHTINDSHELGLVPAGEVLVHSSNIGAVKIADMLGKKKLYQRSRLFGFGAVTGIDVPEESEGKLPNPRTWSKLSLPTISFGQGVAVSPIQLAMSYATIANGGEMLRPHIIREVHGRDGNVERMERMKIRRVISEKNAARIEELLCQVVESGTGASAAVSQVRIAGKTGTAQRVREGVKGYAQGKYISSFIGFVSDREPKLLCLVMIDSPRGMYYGSQVAGPVFRNIINRVLNMGDSPIVVPIMAEGDSVTVKEERTVPDLTGNTIDAAVASLEAMGLEARVVGEAASVARQVPVAGVVVTEGSRVTLYSTAMRIAEGNRICVPQLRGKSIREAVQHLNRANLGVKVRGSGLVKKQTPAAGTYVEHGTVCMLICEKR